MPRILKHFMRPAVAAYVFTEARELDVGEAEEPEKKKAPPPTDDIPPPEAEEEDTPVPPDAPPTEPAAEGETAEPASAPDPSPIDFAKVQAEAIMNEAKREAQEYRERAKAELETELESLRKTAQEEGYSRGYAEGMANGMREAKVRREELAAEQIRSVKEFLEEAARQKSELLDHSRKELRDLALTIAEKVIRVSLKGSGDIVLRMIESATDKRKRCAWAHIYLAGCDVKGMAYSIPELTAALGHISDRVRIIPMADDESGTCVIETSDGIIDASVSTQLGAIREVMKNAGFDKDGG